MTAQRRGATPTAFPQAPPSPSTRGYLPFVLIKASDLVDMRLCGDRGGGHFPPGTRRAQRPRRFVTCLRAPSTERSSWERPGRLPLVPSTQATLNGRTGCWLYKATSREAPEEDSTAPQPDLAVSRPVHLPSGCLYSSRSPSAARTQEPAWLRCTLGPFATCFKLPGGISVSRLRRGDTLPLTG